MLKRLYAYTTWIAAVAFILLALMVSVARVFLPLVAEERALIEARVGELLGQPIRIASVEADIRWLVPRAYLQDVEMLDPSGEQVLLRAEQFIIDFDPLDSLLALAPRIRQVSVRGVDLEVTRTHDDRLVVLGVWEQSLREAARERSGAAWAGLRDLRFNVGESRVHWVDEPTGRDFVFERIQLAIELDEQRLRVAGRLDPPADLGKSLEVVADLRGDLHRAGGWSGSVYARGDSLHFPLLPAGTLLARQGLEEGEGSIEVWSRWREGRPVRIAGKAALKGLAFRLAPAMDAPGSHRLDRLAGRFVWEDRGDDGWRLQAEELSVERDGRAWPAGGFEVALKSGEDGRFLRVSSDTLRLEDVAPLARLGDYLDPDLRERLARLAPRGDVRDLWLDASWQGGRVDWLRADGRVGNLGFEPLPELRLPGLSGLDAHFEATRDGGELTLITGGLGVTYPNVFEQPLEIEQLLGTLQWRRGRDGWRVQTDRMQVVNADLRVAGTLAVEGPRDAATVIDLRLDVEDGRVAAVHRYLPKTLAPNVRSWLAQSLVDGRIERGHVVMLGPLNRFPYRDGGGEFEARLEVSGTTLDYQKGWPVLRGLDAEVRFNGPGLDIAVSGGRLFDSRIEGGAVRIADFRAPLLDVQARSRGPAGDVLRYLAESPLAHARADRVALVEASGPAVYQVGLQIPLSRKLNRELTLDSRLELGGVTLAIPSAAVTLTDLRGAVHVARDDIRADGVRGRFGESDLSLSAERMANGDVRIRGEGDLPPAELLAPYVPELAARFQGRSPTDVELVLPLASGNATALSLRTPLDAVAVDLPSPLGKPAGQRRDLRLHADFGADAESLFHVGYGQVLEMAFTLGREAGETTRVTRADIRINGGRAQLPERGVRLSGRVAHFDPQDWREALAPEDGAGAGSGSQSLHGIPAWLTEMELEVGQFDLFGRSVQDLRISAEREARAWRALVNARPLSGLITLPDSPSAATPMQLQLEHLDLDLLRAAGAEDDAPPDGQGGGIDPRDLPSLRVSSGIVVFQGQRYRGLTLETARQSTGQQVHVFQIGHAHGNLRAWGEWRVRENARQVSSFRFDGSSPNLGKLLTQLGFATGISRGEARVTGDLAWSGAPTDLAPERLRGKTYLLVEKGRLTQVDPGAGRLIGLLNLSNLPRRLSLDFSDVFQKGFAFDRIEGNLQFVDQAMYTNDLRIEGPAARITLTGRTGIAERSYDQIAVVRPQVGGTLPVAGALMGGPGVGAAVFVLQKLLSGNAESVSAGIEYSITGSWDQPVIEKVASPEPEPDEQPASPWQ